LSEPRYRESDEDWADLPAFFLDPLGVLRRRNWWMLAALSLGLLLTFAVVVSSKPRYIAEATVLITSQKLPEDFVRSTVREDTIANINAMVGRVVSHSNLGRIMDQLDLYQEVGPQISRADLVARMRSKISVAPQKSSTRSRGEASLIYGISFESHDADEAANVSNALAALFVEASIARRSEQARTATEFLRRALERDEQDLREHSKRLSEFRQAHRGELPGEVETNLRKLEMLEERRHSLVTQIAEIQNRLVTITAGFEREPTEDEVMLEELRRALAHQVAVHTEDHPNVAALRRRVAEQKEIVAQERAEGAAGSPEATPLTFAGQAQAETLRAQLVETEEKIIELDARIDRAPVVGEGLAALEQKEQVLRENYLESLRKVERAELAESLESAQQGAQVSVLDPAQPPNGPTRPRWKMLSLGIAASVAFALGVGVLLEFLDPVVLTTDQLEVLAKQPALGSVPRVT
jgi:succinoglycan biosynthesis transport protein ExoP